MTAPLRVLIVEDEAVILMQMEMLIQDAGHVVVGTAMRSEEATGLARELLPDIALVDLHLCDGDSGVVVAQKLHAMGGVMVVFVTANPRQLGDDFAGAAGVIVKPFTRAVVATGMPYLVECLRRPPPAIALPTGMRMAPEYLPR